MGWSIAFVADVHIGNHRRFGGQLVDGTNARAAMALGALDSAVELSNGVDDFVVLGDLFHEPDPSPALIARTAQALRDGPSRKHLIPGNHDARQRSEWASACAPLAQPETGISVMWEPDVVRPTPLRGGVGRRGALYLIPFDRRPATAVIRDGISDLEPSPRNAWDSPRILGFHAGIRDASTPPWLRDAQDAIDLSELWAIMTEHDIRVAIAGNWHEPRRWDLTDKGGVERTIIQCGALCPTGFSDCGFDRGRVWRVDVVDRDRVGVGYDTVPGPRFYRKQWGGGDTRIPSPGKKAFVFLSVVGVAPHTRAEAEAWCAGEKRAGRIDDYTIDEDTKTLASAARDAATAARAAPTLLEALQTYVAGRPLPVGLGPERVVARVQEMGLEGEIAGSTPTEPVVVEELRLHDFTTHKHTHVTLPGRGIVAVTGPNGGGKSSTLEAVAWGLWGQTLRGHSRSPCVRGGTLTRVQLQLTNARVARERTRRGDGTHGPATVTLSALPDAYASGIPREVDPAIAARFGTFDRWRRTSVFSSSDAAHFSLASDGERKRLLEDALGLSCFDTALDRARAALVEARQFEATERAAHINAGHDVALARARLDDAVAHEQKVRDQQAAWVGFASPSPVELERARAAVTKLLALKDKIAKLRTDHEVLVGNLRTRAFAVFAELERAKGTTCPTCRRPWQPAEAATVIDACEARSLELGASIEAELWRMPATDPDLDLELAEAHWRVRDLEQAAAAARANEWLAGQLAELVEEAQQATAAQRTCLADHIARQLVLAGSLQDAQRAVEELVWVEDALSLTGVRALVLDRALASLSALATAWLGRIRPGLSLELRSYSERPGGKVRDAIDLVVSGAAGGEGYHGASSGERRAIDLALLLALGEVRSGGALNAATLWFDEVFDGLDDAAREAAIQVIAEIAETRCCVVVTPIAGVAAQLPAVVRLKVVGGEVMINGE